MCDCFNFDMSAIQLKQLSSTTCTVLIEYACFQQCNLLQEWYFNSCLISPLRQTLSDVFYLHTLRTSFRWVMVPRPSILSAVVNLGVHPLSNVRMFLLSPSWCAHRSTSLFACKLKSVSGLAWRAGLRLCCIDQPNKSLYDESNVPLAVWGVRCQWRREQMVSIRILMRLSRV